MWEKTVTHIGLNKFRVIRGNSQWEVEQKADAQKRTWDEMWEKKVSRDRAALERENVVRERARIAQNHEESKSLAATLTSDAQDKIQSIENTLLRYLEKPAKVDWEQLKQKKPFPTKKPNNTPPLKGKDDLIPPEPKDTDYIYKPQISFIDYIIPGRVQKKHDQAKELFKTDHKRWEERKQKVIDTNTKKDADYQDSLNKYQDDFQRRYTQWETEKKAYEDEQSAYNTQIDLRKQAYIDGTKQGVEDLIELVLYQSDYPESFPEEYDVEYNLDTGMIVIDYVLPNISHLPNIKDVKYIQARSEFKENYLTESTVNKMYDMLIYQIALRTVHEVFSADDNSHVKAITTNGWVNYIDKATGQDAKACIISLHTNRDEFMSISLTNVEPKACFKKLKGVGSSKLHTLTPVAPLMRINREDPRFVNSYDVAHILDETVNLAAMDWQDFEHLIRELFEKEFSQSNGEVKITQASRDGGVDAVVFDPDPIRGGKIVIQAKRYTNTVGLSAVRDLYGTVVNEGAIKGILVSTADYGPDAYSFAKDKPITLLDGANLLFLLSKHGHNAKIDLKEAKKLLAEQS